MLVKLFKIIVKIIVKDFTGLGKQLYFEPIAGKSPQ